MKIVGRSLRRRLVVGFSAAILMVAVASPASATSETLLRSIENLICAQLKMCARQRDRDLWLEGYRQTGFEV